MEDSNSPPTPPAENAPPADNAPKEAAPEELPPAAKAIEDLHEMVHQVAAMLKASEAAFRVLKKEVKKLGKKKRGGGPSNLMKPIPLSPALCSILSQPEGSCMTRGAVTSAINEYAKQKNIKKENNGRIIIIDEGLSGLLGLEVGAEMQVFHVQKYLKEKGHYD